MAPEPAVVLLPPREHAGLGNRTQWVCPVQGEWGSLHMMWQPGAHHCLGVPLSRAVKAAMLSALLCRNVGEVMKLVLKQGFFSA